MGKTIFLGKRKLQWTEINPSDRKDSCEHYGEVDKATGGH